ADLVVAKLEPRLSLAEQWMLDGKTTLPAALRLELRIAAVDLIAREVGGTDEVEEIELRDGSAQNQLVVPAAAGLPVQRDAGLGKLELAVCGCVAAHFQARHLV